MMNDSVTKVRIEVPIGSLNRHQISAKISDEFGTQLEYSYNEMGAAQHLDVAISSAIAGIILGIVQVALTLWDISKRNEWNLDKIKTSVRQRAAEFAGSDEITDLRFNSLKDFFDEKSDFCTVTADIHDELYTFVVLREGSVIVIKQETT